MFLFLSHLFGKVTLSTLFQMMQCTVKDHLETLVLAPAMSRLLFLFV